MAEEEKKVAEETTEGKKHPNYVNPVIAWSCIAATLIICVGSALIAWL